MSPKKKVGMILAWDKSYWDDEQLRLLHLLAPYFDLIKVGLETIFAWDAVGASVAAKVIKNSPKPVMLDAKLLDILNTIYRALENIAEHREKIKMVTLHAHASDETLRVAAMMHKEAGILPLLVTLLTDLSDSECVSRFGRRPNSAVLRATKNVRAQGIKGLVCSPQELLYLRKKKGVLEGMVTVVPSIRPLGVSWDDQKRAMTPTEAARAGADYVVVGRPVFNAPDPVVAAVAIRRELDTALAE
jgi:orotidine-5'-phosphate decarboxylase